jgi:FtsH-binding integral membrane protein
MSFYGRPEPTLQNFGAFLFMGFIGIVIASLGDAFARFDGFSVRHIDCVA